MAYQLTNSSNIQDVKNAIKKIKQVSSSIKSDNETLTTQNSNLTSEVESLNSQLTNAGVASGSTLVETINGESDSIKTVLNTALSNTDNYNTLGSIKTAISSLATAKATAEEGKTTAETKVNLLLTPANALAKTSNTASSSTSDISTMTTNISNNWGNVKNALNKGSEVTYGLSDAFADISDLQTAKGNLEIAVGNAKTALDNISGVNTASSNLSDAVVSLSTAWSHEHDSNIQNDPPDGLVEIVNSKLAVPLDTSSNVPTISDVKTAIGNITVGQPPASTSTIDDSTVSNPTVLADNTIYTGSSAIAELHLEVPSTLNIAKVDFNTDIVTSPNTIIFACSLSSGYSATLEFLGDDCRYDNSNNIVVFEPKSSTASLTYHYSILFVKDTVNQSTVVTCYVIRTTETVNS